MITLFGQSINGEIFEDKIETPIQKLFGHSINGNKNTL